MRLFLLFCMLVGGVSLGAQPKASYQGFKQVNGTQLYCEVIGEGEPILIVHGGPSMNHDYFLPWLQPLAQQYQLIFYDQRASGRSPIPPDSNKDISYRILVDDIEALRNAFGIGKLNIMAHSWGAKLAVSYALQYPEHMGKMVLISPIPLSHAYDSLQLATLSERTPTADKETRKTITGSKAFMNGDMQLYKSLLSLMYKPSFYDTANISKLNIVLNDDFYHTNAVLMRGLITDQARYDKDYYPLLKAIKTPVLILHGMADNIPLQASQQLQSSIKGSKLVVFSRSGHFPFVEEQKQFTDSVTAFMSKP